MSATKKTTGSESGEKSSSSRSSARKTAAQKPAGRRKPAAAKKPSTRKSASKKKTTRRKPAAAKKPSTRKSASKKKTTRRKPAKAKTKGKAEPRKPTAKKRAAKKPARRSRREPAKLDAKSLAAIKGELEDELAELRRAESEIREGSSDGTQSEVTGEVGIDEDFADAGTTTFDRERDFSIQNNVLDLIDQVTRALERVEEGTYGSCERCGRPIDRARLKARPRTLLCMDCKRREERAR